MEHPVDRRKKTKAQLIEELTALLDALPAYVWFGNDAECRVITGNRAANEMTGVPAGANVSQSGVPDGRAVYLRQLKEDGSEYRSEELPMQRAIATGRPVRDAYIDFRFPDGRRVETIGNAAPLFDASGAARGALAAFFDVTERRRTEDALRQSESELAEAQRVAKLGNWTFDIPRNAVRWSAELFRIFDVEQSGFRGLYESFVERVHPDDCALVLRVNAAARETGNPFEVEYRIRTRSGELRTIREIGYSKRDASGNVVGLFGTAQDITERKRVEDELRALHSNLEGQVRERTEELARANRALQEEISERRKAEEALRDLYDNAPCGYHSLDGDGVVIRMNDTELKWLGYEKDEVVGKVRFTDFLTEEGKEIFKIHFPRFKERGELRDLEFRILRRDGTALPVLLNATAVKDGEGNYLMSRSTLFDISERKKAETETVRQAKLATLGELAASVAHEINNPINSIVNYAQILANKGEPHGKEHPLAGKIIQEGMRIASIVKSLLSYARDTKDRKIPLSVPDLVFSTLALTSALLRKDGIRVTAKVPDNLPQVLGNAQQLQQVFLNIISNASHALKEKYEGPHQDKVLEIMVDSGEAEGGGMVRLSFCDHGSGIPAPILGRVREPFFTTKPASLGTGLGLSISSTIVADHKGSLTIDSEEGQYTKVTIELPAAPGSLHEGDP